MILRPFLPCHLRDADFMPSTRTADFCIWLKSFLDRCKGARTPEEVAIIRQRLSEVFVHEIDPAMGDTAHQNSLNQIHHGVH